MNNQGQRANFEIFKVKSAKTVAASMHIHIATGTRPNHFLRRERRPVNSGSGNRALHTVRMWLSVKMLLGRDNSGSGRLYSSAADSVRRYIGFTRAFYLHTDTHISPVSVWEYSGKEFHALTTRSLKTWTERKTLFVVYTVCIDDLEKDVHWTKKNSQGCTSTIPTYSARLAHCVIKLLT